MSTGKRVYSSDLRERQARETRRQIVAAGAALFTERGYAGTTIDAVAEQAGVSRKTVFTSVGGKAVLLKLAYDWGIVGDDEPVALEDREEIASQKTETDPLRVLDRFAAHTVRVQRRVAPLYLALRDAAAVDAEARETFEEMQRERLTGMSHLAAHLAKLGGLRKGLSRNRATDLLYFHIDPGHYDLLVTRRRWSLRAYQDWMAAALKLHLLGEGEGSG